MNVPVSPSAVDISRIGLPPVVLRVPTGLGILRLDDSDGAISASLVASSGTNSASQLPPSLLVYCGNELASGGYVTCVTTTPPPRLTSSTNAAPTAAPYLSCGDSIANVRMFFASARRA